MRSRGVLQYRCAELGRAHNAAAKNAEAALTASDPYAQFPVMNSFVSLMAAFTVDSRI